MECGPFIDVVSLQNDSVSNATKLCDSPPVWITEPGMLEWQEEEGVMPLQ